MNNIKPQHMPIPVFPPGHTSWDKLLFLTGAAILLVGYALNDYFKLFGLILILTGMLIGLYKYCFEHLKGKSWNQIKTLKRIFYFGLVLYLVCIFVILYYWVFPFFRFLK
jgi:hypothetical protein